MFQRSSEVQRIVGVSKATN